MQVYHRKSISPLTRQQQSQNQLSTRSKKLTEKSKNYLNIQPTPVGLNQRNKRANCKTAVPNLNPQKQQSDSIRNQLLDTDYNRNGKSSRLSKKRTLKLLGKNNKQEYNNKQTAATNIDCQYTPQRGSNRRNRFSDSKSENSFASATTASTLPTNSKLIGRKRQSQIGANESERKVYGKKSYKEGAGSPCHSIMSFGDEVNPESSGKDPEMITLKSKKDPKNVSDFRLVVDKNLQFMGKKYKDILHFDMNKLEIEYDYDTDEEQMMRAKSLLLKENFKAIEFFVKEEPMLLVGNLQTSVPKDNSKQ